MKADKALVRVALPADGVPEPICAACADDVLFDHIAEAAIVYCPHACAGAVMPMGERRWIVTEGVARNVFLEKAAHELAAARLLKARRNKAH